MLKNLDTFHVLMWNVVIIGAWHIALFIACIKLPSNHFDASRPRYAARHWERNGRFYRDSLKINRWKDILPQHVGKDGFSKAHLTDVSIEYLDQFILETCRGEWEHTANCGVAVITLFINPIPVGFIFSFLVLLGNVPFVCIQRYNRFRLQVLRKRRLREMQSLNRAAEGAAAATTQ